ncbi:UNVERIFIED_CONTAM: NAC domain-containing protein 67 [Sesamum latifolium]|uniref:NAC domain-containing protein 67 n=1 Tax=Sesamum latifolium TaxID=2727402 RepID=A0AAW2V0K1_9LAMI
MDLIQRLLSDADFPLGFRFHPTDVELLLHYLLPKLKGEDLSSSEFIMDFLDVYQHDPDQLPLGKFRQDFVLELNFTVVQENQIFYVISMHAFDIVLRTSMKDPIDLFKHGREKEAYFFTLEEIKNSQGEGPVRTTPTGYWKAYREDVPIYHDKEIIGFKNKLSFYRGNDPNGTQTDWKMTEYICRIATTSTATVESYVVCKVRQKMRVEEDERFVEEENGFIEGNA